VAVLQSEIGRTSTISPEIDGDRPWIAGEYWPRCHICGYDRRAQEHWQPCPECGTVVPDRAAVIWGRSNDASVSKVFAGALFWIPILLMFAVPPESPLVLYLLIGVVGVSAPFLLKWRARQSGRDDYAFVQLLVDPDGYGMAAGYGRVKKIPWPRRVGYKPHEKQLRLYRPLLGGSRWWMINLLTDFRPSGITPLEVVHLIEQSRGKRLRPLTRQGVYDRAQRTGEGADAEPT
jgi:hypothetical protein